MPLYYPSNEVIAFTAGSAEVAARIHGPVFPCQEIKKETSKEVSFL